AVGKPEVVFQGQSDPAILADNQRTAVVGGVDTGMGIGMNIEHIACTGIVVAATGRIDQTRRVVTFRPFGNLTGLELPPCLIEGNPHHNTRMTAQLVDDTAPLTAES